MKIPKLKTNTIIVISLVSASTLGAMLARLTPNIAYPLGLASAWAGILMAYKWDTKVNPENQ